VPGAKKAAGEFLRYRLKGEKDDLRGYVNVLMNMSVSDIHEVKKQLGLSASGNKLELAKKVAAKAMRESQLRFRTAPPLPKPPAPSQDKIDRKAPMADRLKAYASGDAKVKALAGAGGEQQHIMSERNRLEAEVQALYSKRASLKSKKLGKRDSEALNRLYLAQAEAFNLSARPDADIEQQRANLKKTLAVLNPAPIEYRMSVSIAKSNVGVKKAQQFLFGLVAGPLAHDVLVRDYNGHRGQYTASDRAIDMNAHMGEQVGLVVHEWGHHIEYNVPGAKKAAGEFLRYRLKGEKPQKLKDVLPQRKYKNDEIAAKDEFDKAFGPESGWYVGKIYSGGATEIISMGLERLYEDGAAFARKDPEYCKFILGVLDGSLL
jgi:hypothetical protein